jgi:hypothetical protein
VIGNVVVYRDHNHLTKTFVTTLAPLLIERVQQVVDELVEPPRHPRSSGS